MSSSTQKRFLLVDGNYFCHRLIHGIRIGQPDFNLTTNQQMFNFESSLNDGLINLYKSFNNDYHQLIDNMIFVFDNKSWRKSVFYEKKSEDGESLGFELFRPYYIPENDSTPLGYKDNRKEQKEDSDIDYDNFNICMDNFRQKIKNGVACLHFEGGEGDDALTLLTNTFSVNLIESILFATDGDLKALVNKYTLMLRNVKSKELPDGEFVISKYLYRQLFSEKTMMEKFTELNLDSMYYNLLFNVDVSGGGSVKSNKIRKPNSGVNITESNKNLLLKVICGDAKDNIFPIFRWKSSTGTKNMKVTETMVSKAFDMSLMDFDEKSIGEAFADNKIMSSILMNLKSITKQSTAPLGIVAKHYNHNLKMNKLSIDIFPEYVKENFQKNYDEIKHLIYQDLKLEDLLKLNLKVDKRDSAKELIISSIPNILDIDDTISTTKSTTGNSIVDDILNSN